MIYEFFGQNNYWRLEPKRRTDQIVVNTRNESLTDTLDFKLIAANNDSVEEASLHPLPDVLVTNGVPRHRFFNSQTCFLVGEKSLLELLLKYKLPKFLVFNISVESEVPLEKEYQIIGFESRLHAEGIVSESTYNIIDRATLKKIDEVKGIASSFEELTTLRKMYRREKNQLLTVSTFALDREYDIFWGGNNSLYISERLKKAVETAEYQGVKVLPFNMFDVSTINLNSWLNIS